MRLKDRVVFITGASRGIGKECALACAREGAHIVVAAKTTDPNPKLPGTIHETVTEVKALGRKALGIQLDVRDAEACAAAIEETVRTFGRIDALINNAGALWWADVTDTPVRKFDLVIGVNVRASYALAHAALPHMIKQKWGHIIMMSPPVDAEAVAHHAAYAVSKFGMTMIAQGIAEEYKEHNVAGHALWPATAVESQATKNFGMGDASVWRKASIIADATVALLAKEPRLRTGKAWIDEDLLREEGVTDFTKYRCDPNVEPPKFAFRDIPALQSTGG